VDGNSIWLEEFIPMDCSELLKSLCQPNMKFIQVGANDGRNDDNIYRFIKKYNWKGLLIEPIPSSFEQLKKNYQSRRHNLIFENVAIHPSRKRIGFYVPKKNNEKMRASVKFPLPGRRKLTRKQVKKINVPACTLDELIEKHSLFDFQWLHVDAEGYDYHVLKTCDLSRYLPKVIVYEHAHLRDRKECKKYIESLGYTIKNYKLDNVCVKK
jgi:FkbM family methyltransferase